MSESENIAGTPYGRLNRTAPTKLARATTRRACYAPSASWTHCGRHMPRRRARGHVAASHSMAHVVINCAPRVSGQ